VTCAIALFRSRQFVDRITANIKAINYPNVEIIISDRHSEDDALVDLKKQHADDPRVRFVQAQDRLSWVEHYNRLLGEGRGKYFRWMPHDDEFPACCLREMVDLMEKNVEVVLVYGPAGAFDDNRNHIPELCSLIPNPPIGVEWSFDIPIFLNFNALAIGAFKGLFRRDPFILNGMAIRPTHNLAHSERLWLMGASLLGRFYFLESWQYRKYFYPGSTSSNFVYDWRVTVDSFRISLTYLYLAKVGWRKLFSGTTALFVLTLKKLFPRASSRWMGRFLPDDQQLAQWLRQQ
jgi:glycosyltransferase involved in cell wall biosynthesis